MDYFGGIALVDRGCELAVVDSSDRLVAQFELPRSSELERFFPMLKDLRSVLTLETGRADATTTALLRAGVRLVAISGSQLRYYDSLRPAGCASNTVWLAHLCWLNPGITGPIYSKDPWTIRDRLRMRADTFTYWR